MSTNTIPSGMLRSIGHGASEEVKDAVGPSKLQHCDRHDEDYAVVWLSTFQFWLGTCALCRLETETGRPQPRRGQSAEDFRLSFSCVPTRFEGKRLKDFPGKSFRQALDTVKNFQPTDSLLILGPLGSGKTSFSCALLHELLLQPWALELSADVAGRYYPTRGLMERLWDDSNPKQFIDGGYGADLRETLEHLWEIPVLLIDDLSGNIHTAEEVAWVQRILAARRDGQRATILVGSDLESLEAVLGSRTLDQLRGWKQIYLGKEGG